ncbi:tetratricopeptide repeat protein [Bizionia sp. KMM 8389]
MQEQDYSIFESYLSGELNPDEQLAFHKRLQTDETFKQAFETYNNTSSYLKHAIGNETKNLDFKANLESASNTYFKNQANTSTKQRRINPWYYSVAAAAIIIIGFFIGQQFSSPVYADFADYGTISLTVRGEQDNLLAKAEAAFNNQDYQAANAYFTELLQLDSSHIELQLYKAVSMVELSKYTEADEILIGISQSPSVFRNKAKWYLALSKLKQDQINACLDVLHTIPEDAEDYSQAQKLIRKLD